MGEFFLHVFDEALRLKNSELITLENEITISNPYTQQIYNLNQRYKYSENTFVCEDLSYNKLNFKIIPCSS